MISRAICKRRIIKSSPEKLITGQEDVLEYYIPKSINKRETKNEMLDVSSHEFSVLLKSLEGGEMYTEENPELSTYWKIDHIRPTKTQEYQVFVQEYPIVEATDLTGVEYVWKVGDILLETDLSIKNEWLEHKFQDEEEKISELKSQLKRYEKKIKDLNKKVSLFDEFSQKIEANENIIISLNKELKKYKARLNLFSFKFSLPEDYYGNEKFND